MPAAMRGVLGLFAAFFFVLFATDLDDYLSVRGLLPVNTILLLLGAFVALPALLAVADRLRTTLELTARAVLANRIPLFFFALWIVLHVLQAGNAILGPETDYTRILPILQFTFLVFGMAIVAASAADTDLVGLGLTSSILVLGTSVMVETYSPHILGSTVSRSGGIALNANVAAFILNAALACLLDFRRTRTTDLVMILFTLTAVLSTLSRSGVAQFLLIALVYLASHGTRAIVDDRPAKLVGLIAKTLLVGAFVLGVAVALGNSLASKDPEFHDRLEVLSFHGSAIYEDPYRYQLLEHYYRLALERPFLGFGTAHALTTAMVSAPLGKGPHNMYLNAWVDHGLVGVTLFGAILLSMLLTSVLRRDLNGVVLALIVIEYSAFSHNSFDTTATPLFLGIVLARSALRNPEV